MPNGTRLAEFEIREVLGLGGFGIVYLAYDHSLHRLVAIKEYLPGSLAHRDGTRNIVPHSEQQRETFEAGLKSFIQEARLLAQFDHPALVKVYRFWEANGTAYMATAYYEGETLKRAYSGTRPTRDEVVHIIAPLLDAVEVMHRARCYHRDIAPDNVIVQPSGQAVLLDFGAARRIIGEMTQALTVVLKSGYAPIEQYADDSSQAQGPWTDVYALGAMIHWMIRGKSPPPAVVRAVGNDPYVPLARESHDEFDRQFLAGVDRALAMKAEARPQSMGELRSALGIPAPRATLVPRSVAAEMPPDTDKTVPAPHPRDVQRARERRRYIAIFGALLAAACVITVLIVLNLLGPPAPEPNVATTESTTASPPVPATVSNAEPAPAPATPPPAAPATPPETIKPAPPAPSVAKAPVPSKPAAPQPSITDAKEQYQLARDLQRGKGMEKNPDEAIVWLRRSAEQGYARAQLALGAAYERGDGVTKDAADAFGWYRRAAAQGNVEAELKVAEAYKDGIGVAKDQAEALAWYGKAAAKGNAEAKDWIARLQPSPKEPSSAMVKAGSAPKDAAEQYELALDYRMGRKGKAINLAQAAKWYRAAADQGHAAAQDALGAMYQNGEGVQLDYAEARKWFEKSAANGNASALNNLGRLYGFGQGVRQNDVLAAQYYRKAADAGNAWGMRNLAWSLENGRGVFRDATAAAELYRKAASAGNTDAMFRLGRLYERGEGVKKDESEALRWFRMASAAGHKDAAQRVARLDAARK